MTETRVKARRYRIFQLSSFDCMTEKERVLYDKYEECNNKAEKMILHEVFEKEVKNYKGIRSIPDERLRKKNKDGSLSDDYIEKIQNPLFEGEMARIANDFKETFPLIKEIVYFECSLRDILQQIIDNGLMIEGEKYMFYSATTNHMKKEMVILLKESFFTENEKKIMCGLSRDIINKGNDRVKGCNRGKFLAYTSLPMSASVDVSSINTENEQYEIDIDDCIVVSDFEGTVHGKVNYLDINTLKTEITEKDVPIPFMDGAGIFLPDAGVLPRTGQIRGGYFKGCLFPFDFVKFIHSREDSSSKIKDIYGDEVDVIEQGIKVIFTGSQFKMWKYYKDWETFKKTFKECGCKIVLNNLAHTPSKNAEVLLTYQFLQTLPRDNFTEEAMELLCAKTVKLLCNSKIDVNTALKLMGADEDSNKELKPLQAALLLYPKLVNDSAVKEMIKENINTIRKKAMGGKIMVDGFYTYICPDLYAFCENLFCGIADPKGLIPGGTVYNAYYNDKDITEVDCLRSPHLGDSEHCIRTLVKTKECKEWFHGFDTIISNHDLITKHLMCDVDGDEMLITSSQELISLVDRDKPALYYDMEKADAEQITDEVLFECLVSSFDNSIIGNISNALTKLYSVDDEPNYELIRILTAYNNWMIDYPKTQKAMDLKQFAEEYQAWTDNKKHKLPHYFIYAKDKSETSVASYTNCNVDRVCQYIESTIKKTKYKIFDSEEVINPEIFKDKDIEVVRTSKEYLDLVELLGELHYKAQNVQRKTKRIKNKMTENKSIDENILKTDLHYYLCREAILNIFGDERKAASYLVDAEYYQHEFKSGNKKLIWNCFGDVIVENIKKNLASDKPLKVRRDQYITKNTETHKNLLNAVVEVNKEMEEEKVIVQTDIIEKELEWIDGQQYRKNCQTDRLLLFIFLYLQKRYGKDGCFKIRSKVKKGITPKTIDDWIGSDICKKGINRLEKKHLITTECVVNKYGQYTNVSVNIPDFEEQDIAFSVMGGNPLIPLYEHTGERKVKTCQMCGKKFVANGNAKTCGAMLCRKRLEKETKDKCNKNAV